MNLILLKIILIFVLLHQVLGAIKISNAEYRKEFFKFKKDFNLTYPNSHAELVAFTYFKQNYATVKEANLEFAQGNSTFRLSLSANADQADEFIGQDMNNLVEEDDSFAARSDVPEFPPTNLSYLNYAEENCMTPVVNQGKCGACYAFAVPSAIEGVCCKRRKNLVNLSEQQIIDCTFNSEYSNLGCKGGKVSSAFLYAMDFGAVDGSSYPYTARDNGTCNYDETKVVQRFKNFIRLSKKVDEEYLKRALAANGPIVVGMNGASKKFQFYKSGVFYDEECSETCNHAVVLVGFGTDEKFGDYWIFKNSYGTRWGENGYFRMARGKGNHCGILNQVFIVFC